MSVRKKRGGRFGLVLSGGGAKGAYQAGVVKALAELEIEISAISGASIGALNGAVLACARSLPEGAVRLEKLWRMIAENPPLEENDPILLRVMNALALETGPVFRNTVIVGKEMRKNLVSTMLKPNTSGLVDNDIIRRTLDDYVSDEGLALGLPLYVSVFPCRSPLEALVGGSLAMLGIKDTPESEFLHIQTLSQEDRRKALLASAAIPFILKAQELNGERYRDGGLGCLSVAQGNTPVSPLLEAGYNKLIVTVLSDKIMLDKSKYPNADLIEIEHCRSINRAPVIPDLLDVLLFHPDKIESWMLQGYEDTIRSMEGDPAS